MIQYVLADIPNNIIRGVGLETASCLDNARKYMKDTDRYVYSNEVKEAIENNALVLTKCDNALREYLEGNGVGKLNGYRLKIKNNHCLTIERIQ